MLKNIFNRKAEINLTKAFEDISKISKIGGHGEIGLHFFHRRKLKDKHFVHLGKQG